MITTFKEAHEIFSENEQELIIELIKTMNQGNTSDVLNRVTYAVQQIKQLRTLFGVEWL